MSIARELGLEATDPLAIIALRWAGWSELQPALKAVGVPAELQRWLQRSHTHPKSQTAHQEVDSVLRALAILAATDGEDDPEAALVLAWVMLPAACAVSHRCRNRAPQLIDQIVAAQLWIAVRSFPWRVRQGSVAGNIAGDLQKAVSEDLDILSPGGDGRSVPADPDDLSLLMPETSPDGPSPEVELLAVLDEAIEDGVIDWGERALLLSITCAAANEPEGRKSTTGVAGLLTAPVEEAVAGEYRSSRRAVRRRASRCVEALARSRGGRA